MQGRRRSNCRHWVATLSAGISPYPVMQRSNNTKWHSQTTMPTQRTQSNWTRSHTHKVTWNTSRQTNTHIHTILTSSTKTRNYPDRLDHSQCGSHIQKGDRLHPNNYRPISLTSITCKMLEHIITSNIMQHLDTHHILHDAQHGLRKHRSTETQLIQLIDNIAHNIDNRIQTDAILLDFQKAFAKVPHQRLLYKLPYYGISPQALNWVQSFLSNRRQQTCPKWGQYFFLPQKKKRQATEMLEKTDLRRKVLGVGTSTILSIKWCMCRAYNCLCELTLQAIARADSIFPWRTGLCEGATR